MGVIFSRKIFLIIGTNLFFEAKLPRKQQLSREIHDKKWLEDEKRTTFWEHMPKIIDCIPKALSPEAPLMPSGSSNSPPLAHSAPRHLHATVLSNLFRSGLIRVLARYLDEPSNFFIVR